MTALTQDRNTREVKGDIESYLMLADTTIFAGSIVVLDASGWAKPGVAGTGLTCVGRAEERKLNAGGNGDARIRVKRGSFRYANSADADLVTQAEIGDNCYVVDDQTVAKTDGGGARSIAGKVDQVDDQGVIVCMGYGPFKAPGGALLAASNLSDVGTKSTARSNLGVAEKFGTPAFTIGAEASHKRNVAIQLKDSANANLAVRGSVFAYLSDDAAGDSLAASAPSGGAAIGTDGLAIVAVANKAFRLVSESTGHLDIDITEATAKSFYLVLVMPDGRLALSAAITFAG
jgi:hypothetical protein